MSPTKKHILTGGAALLLWGATSLAASAYYMGYANGDPGNWGFYEEQHNGASPPAEGEDYFGRPTRETDSPRTCRVSRTHDDHGMGRSSTPQNY